MRGTGDQDKKWNLAVRYLPDIPVKRAELRMTATYAIARGAFVGVEYNPLDDDVGLLANWRVVDEGQHTPMLMVGTSSDRIGTPSGRAYYATLSKGVEPYTGLPIAPYVGSSYGEFDDELVLIGGLGVRWMPELASTHFWDGHNLHHMLDYSFEGGYRLGVVVAEQDGKHYTGVSVGASF